MAVHYTITVEYGNETIADIRKRLTINSGNTKSKTTVFKHIKDEIGSILLGLVRGGAFVRTVAASACASQTVDVSASAAVADTDTLTIASTVLSAKAAVANESQFLIGATDALYVANVVACINAHSVLSKIVRARAVDSNTFRITCIFPGPIGNNIALSEAGNGFTLGGSTLASGASDAAYGFGFGYTPAT